MEDRDHSIKISNRKDLQLTGVLKADSSTEQRIMLKTIMGDMIIDGEELHICHLDLESGEALLGGKVDSLTYASTARSKNKQKNRGSIGKLFR